MPRRSDAFGTIYPLSEYGAPRRPLQRDISEVEANPGSFARASIIGPPPIPDRPTRGRSCTRLYGRAPQGERLVQKVPHGNWKTITFIAALRHDRITAPFVLEGPMTGEMFRAYTEQFIHLTNL
jgi:hypothetical protein